LEPSRHITLDQDRPHLLAMVRPEIYRLNSFRVLEIPVTASVREASSKMRRLELMDKLGDTKQIERGFLALSPQPDRDAKQEAYQRLTDPESRLLDEILWFWRLDPNRDGEDEAFIAMEQNDLSSAVAIWKEQETQSNESYTSTHNLAVIYHTMALDLEVSGTSNVLSNKQLEQRKSYWNEAIPRWRIILEYEGFWRYVEQRIHELDDPRLTVAMLHKIHDQLPLMILCINAILATRAVEKGNDSEASFHVELMSSSGFNKAIINEALGLAVIPIRDRIKILCKNAETETKKAKQHGDKIANDLLNQTAPLLSVLDILLDDGHAVRDSAHDEVATQVLNSAIIFSNETKNWKASQALLQRAVQIGVSTSLWQRLETNIEITNMNLSYSICWFCKNSPSEEKAVLEVKMYGNVTVYGNQIRWRRLSVNVPRCSRCKSIHRRKVKFGWLGAGLGIVLAIFIGSNINGLAGFLAFIISLTIGLVAGRRRPKGVRAEGYKEEFPNVQKLTSEGWKIGDRPPQAH
jgi:hypothetical protein